MKNLNNFTHQIKNKYASPDNKTFYVNSDTHFSKYIPYIRSILGTSVFRHLQQEIFSNH